MKRFALLAVVLVFSSGCASLLSVGQHPRMRSRPAPPPPVSQYSPYVWLNVLRLPRQSIVVLTADGNAVTARFSRANQDGLWLEAPGTPGRFIDRVDVLQIDLVDSPSSWLRGIGRGVLLGAAIGAGLATAALGAGSDTTTPRNPGQVIAASAAMGGIVGGRFAAERRMQRTIYIAP